MRKRTKKLLSILLMSAMSISLFSGCGSSKTDSGEKNPAADSNAQTTEKAVTEGDESKAPSGDTTNLTLWMPPFGTEESLDKEVWGNILKPFEEENNAKVTIEIVPWSNYEEKYLTGISSGQGPDVGYMYMEMINDYIESESITPFDEYLTAEEKDNYYYLDKGVINGKQYAMPIVVGSARVMFCNEDILNAAGVTTIPSTWSEFQDACKKISDSGKTPFLQQWGDKSKGAMNSIFFPYLWQAGGEIFNEEGTEAKFNSEAGIKAAQFLVDLKNNKMMPDAITSMAEDQVFSEFKKGEVAFVMGPTNKGAEFTDAGVKWTFTTSLQDQKMSTFASADSLVMVSASKNKEMAAKMVKYMLSAPSMTEFHKMASFPPVAKDEEYNDDPTFKKVYEEDQDTLVTLPAVKGSAAVYDNLYKNLQLMMLGELTPEEALKNSAEFADNTLSQN